MPGFGKSGISRIRARSSSADIGLGTLHLQAFAGTERASVELPHEPAPSLPRRLRSLERNRLSVGAHFGGRFRVPPGQPARERERDEADDCGDAERARESHPALRSRTMSNAMI